MKDRPEDTRKLRKGYTTGSCAQAAAKGAAVMLLTRKLLDHIDITVPAGEHLRLPLVDPFIGDHYARCGVIKDSGDDPDVTHGTKICALVSFSTGEGITIAGGEGVGIVTKPGLPVPVGSHAINPTPREAILKELSRLLPEGRGIEVVISVPGGEELAKKTYNPRLGVEGGISILGTTGIVQPRSVDAFKASLSLELDLLKAAGKEEAFLVLGYVGERFCRNVLGLAEDSIIKIGDHVGFMLEQCAGKGIEKVSLIGYLGKLVKVAGGQFNTHYRFGDRRIETIAHHARRCGAGPEVIEAILRETTAEASVSVLKGNGLMKVFDDIAVEVVLKARNLVGGKVGIRCILLSLEGEVLGSHHE